MLAKNGATILRVIVRATFDIHPDGHLTMASEQAPVRYKDEYWGEEGKSSVRYESDVSLEKPHTDLLVNGQAYAPDGRAATSTAVGLMFQDRIVKQLCIFGDRLWNHGATGWYMTPPRPFTTMPVTYDRAFGGMDAAGSEARNRVGTGYASQLTSDFVGTRLPNVEFADALIGSPLDRPRPGGFGVISRDWLQRHRFAGTYDDAWLEEQMPLLPVDFDMRFNQSAPEEQWLPRVVGGEVIRVLGMTSDGHLGFRIPRGTINLRLYYYKQRTDSSMMLDCILVDSERRQVEFTWRATADIHGDPFRLRKLVVSTDSSELVPQRMARARRS